MKNDRQTAVLQIIEETAVETQEQLMQLLPEDLKQPEPAEESVPAGAEKEEEK